jgi:hypothetical protein
MLIESNRPAFSPPRICPEGRVEAEKAWAWQLLTKGDLNWKSYFASQKGGLCRALGEFINLIILGRRLQK